MFECLLKKNIHKEATRKDTFFCNCLFFHCPNSDMESSTMDIPVLNGAFCNVTCNPVPLYFNSPYLSYITTL